MYEMLFAVPVSLARRTHLVGGHDVIIDSAPILAWRQTDPDAAVGHAPHHHARPLLRGYRVNTLLCRGSGLPLLFVLSPANVHDAPFARPLLEWAVRLYDLHPCVVRLDAGYWGLKLIAWIHTTLGTVAVVPWNPKRQQNRSCLPPTWTAEELGKRTSIERFFGRVFSLCSPFPLATAAPRELVGRRDPRGPHIRCHPRRRPSSSAVRAIRSHPLPYPRPRSYLGGISALSEAAPS